MSSFPARLHVLLASQAPVGVILRRGPSKSVCSILWNLKTDKFELGQWLRGRIYERRADISPDGRYLIYFAMNGKWASETKGSWTAISRAPWLKAIVLAAKGDCWLGGGLFTSNSSYWLNGGCSELIHDSMEVRRDLSFKPVAYYGGECPSVYYPRLQRDGWILRTKIENGKFNSCTVFEKVHPKKSWILRKFAHEEVGSPPGKGCYWDEHELEHPKLERRLSLPKWEWAEFRGDTVLWAEGGCIHRARVHAKEIGKTETLFDANAMKFEARAAPY
ncbi:MAG: hypothetical protein LAP38_01485 [Acidobacteriia bacterium]|nr:hypothetical protein [Terriglobia bacterium]